MTHDQTATSLSRPYIRPGNVPADIDLCAEIWVRALAARDGSVDGPGMTSRVQASFANPIVWFAVATAPRLGFSLVEAVPSRPTAALLRYLAVDPDGAGRGVGSTLLDDAISHSRLQGFATLLLEVRDINARAIELYTRAGFVPAGAAVPHPLAGYPMQGYELAL